MSQITIFGVTGGIPTPVSVPNGGTGVSSITDGALIVGSGVNPITVLAAAANGEIPIGSVGADPVIATITAGPGINIANAAGSITISNSGGSVVAWTEVTTTSVAMAADNGYILNNAALVTATMPATSSIGDILSIVGKGAGGFLIAQNAGQTIHFISSDTTTGAGGSLASTVRYDCVDMVCVTADTDFVVRSSCGNITVV